ncbi:helix-turn-helix domain-containing protein [Lactococcus lactis]|uniref:helix-turn-helix domain-containing protein n=1 Tax=Lactococcus lactis TaxID=1358 RepID=UPI00071D456F|nr:helix-turn-helix transcriptional regulator [Lactococcus lactis]KST79786.1 transcription regulator [Lactococcus lactis subsp. lactis]MCC4121234.1 helix-turn-helix domain-containing protein [Lactococcus lactis]
MSCNKIFSERLFKLINATGKSVNQIERELGYSRNAISNYKDGSEPSGTRLVELANFFEVTPDYLIGISNDSQTESLNISSFFQKLTLIEKMELGKVYQEWLSNLLKSECSLGINYNVDNIQRVNKAE